MLSKIQIWQLKDDEHDRLFESLEWLARKGLSFDQACYQLVYSFSVDNPDLEEIFTRFNIDRPHDFYGHSLSVSDVVVVDGEAHFVEPIGFSEVPWKTEVLV